MELSDDEFAVLDRVVAHDFRGTCLLVVFTDVIWMSKESVKVKIVKLKLFNWEAVLGSVE